MEAVQQAMRVYSDFGFENPQLYRLMFQDLEAEPNREEEQLAQTCVALFSRGVESGAFRDVDPLEETLKTWALFHGFVQLAISGRVPPIPQLPGVLKPTLSGLRDALLAGLEHELKPS